jgi:PAS domain S-box-containing protein
MSTRSFGSTRIALALLIAASVAGAGWALQRLLGSGWHAPIVFVALVFVLWARERALRTSRELLVRQAQLEKEVQERTFVEGRLREANRRINAILESITDCFCAVDRDWRYSYINANAERYFGRSKESMLGKGVWDVFPESVGSESYRRYQAAMASGMPSHFEVQSPVTRHWLSVHIYPFNDGLAFFWEDIQARKQVEEALAESRERFQSFMDNSPAAAWIKDEDGRYLFMNRAAERSAQLVRGAWHHASDDELFPPEVARILSENDAGALQGAGPVEVIEVLNGRHRLAAKFPLRAPSGRRYVGGMAIDITERLRAEEEVREASRRKDDFLAILSHELRNPLHPIRAAVEIQKRSEPGSTAFTSARVVIERQVAHVARLLDDLLDVSRSSLGRLELRRERVVLADVMRQAAQTSRPLIDAAQVQLDIVYPAESVQLHADPVRLAQVFSNLLNNAAKFTAPGGRIGFEAEHTPEWSKVRVIDNGIGMDAAQCERLFQLFSPSGRTASGGREGLGVGLALARTLVEMHGGSIEGFSAGPGCGSSFSVRLPIDVQAAATPAERRIASAAGSIADLRILVVDDNRDSADSTALLLGSSGAQVRAAYDGRTALELATEFHPGVVVLDIGLPEMDGYEVARRLRSSDMTRQCILIATTGWGQAKDRSAAREAGFDHHLTKPVDPADLVRAIADVAARRKS